MIVLKRAGQDAKAKRPRAHRLLVGLGVSLTMLALVMVVVGLFLPDDWLTRLKYYRLGATAEVETLVLDIKYKHYVKLAAIRDEVLQTEDVERYKDTYVPAELQYGNTRHLAKIRLKGDRLVHYRPEKEWSFRVRLRGDHTLFGTKTFSLHKPRSRNYIYEWLFHCLSAREKMINLQYKFVRLVVNGENLGIYALEEHFDKYVLERNQYREGPILHFSNDLFIDLSLSVIMPFRKSIWNVEPRATQARRAIQMLEGFRQGELKISQVFEVEKLATLFAMADLTGTHHGVLFKSMRLYYNPVTSKLIPIPFDGHFGTEDQLFIAAEIALNPASGWYYHTFGGWFKRFFNDPEHFDPRFYEAYLAALKRLSEPTYLDTFFEEVQPELDKNLAIIYRDGSPLKDNINYFGPELFVFSKQPFYDRAKYIREALEMRQLHAYAERQDDKLLLEVHNLSRIPFKLVGVSREAQPTDSTEATSMVIHQFETEPMVIPALPSLDQEADRFEVPLNEAAQWVEGQRPMLILLYRRLGEETILRHEIFPWPFHRRNAFNDDPLLSTRSNDVHSFLQVDDSKKTMIIPRGNWRISENLVVPDGYRLLAGPGVVLDLTQGANILVRGSLELIGTREEPIIIESRDGTGQGLAVIRSKEKSTLQHLVVRGLSEPRHAGWTLTGAVTFYESEVRARNIVIKQNRSEDGMNLIRCRFDLEHVSFQDTASDAFDADFCTGRIAYALFENCTNDGIDVSGSKIKLYQVTMNGIGDKGVSVGEQSLVTALDVTVENAFTAFASKDYSTLDIVDAKLRNNLVDFAVYRKKPEFGPATLNAQGVDLDKPVAAGLIESGSTLRLNGNTMPPNLNGVLEQLEKMNEAYRAKKASPQGGGP